MELGKYKRLRIYGIRETATAGAQQNKTEIGPIGQRKAAAVMETGPGQRT